MEKATRLDLRLTCGVKHVERGLEIRIPLEVKTDGERKLAK